MGGMWKQSKLGAFADVKYGKSTPRDAGEIPVIGSGGVFGYTSVPLVEYTTLVIGRKGTAGKVWFLKEPSWPSDTTFYLEWKNAAIDPSYLYYALQARPLSGEHARTTMPSLQRQDLEEYDLLVPPLPVQRAIAHALQTVEEAKEARQRELALERERKAALMEYLFTHGTRGEATKQSEIGEIPESWSVRPLNQIADLFSGGTPSKARPEWWKGSIPWVSTKDLKKPRLSDVTDHITEEAVQEGSRLVPANSLFVGIRGMILAKEIPVCLATVPMAFNQDVKAVVPHEGISPDFLLYAMNFFKSVLNHHVGTSAHGTKRISGDAIATMGIPLPPAEEQNLIADALTACDEKLVALSQEHTLLSELFNALLEELMTGKVDVEGLIDRGPNG